MTFRNAEESHAHSLETLNVLYEYDDFMESVGTVLDLGCGAGLDMEWWATRTTRDDPPRPLNIRCVGVDQHASIPATGKGLNISYQSGDFENNILVPKRQHLMYFGVTTVFNTVSTQSVLYLIGGI